MPIYDRATSNSTPGRLDLDSPPSAPADRVKPKSAPTPGDDTMSLLGANNVNGPGAGVSANTPTGRALVGVMKMMQGANEVESVVPGAIPPPLMQLIQQLSVTLPEIVRNMQQMTGPGGMLSSMGMPPAMPPMMGGPMGAPPPPPMMGMQPEPQNPLAALLGGLQMQ